MVNQCLKTFSAHRVSRAPTLTSARRGYITGGSDSDIWIDPRGNSWVECSVDQLAELCESEVMSLLDSFIPARTVTIKRHTSDPWFDQECRQAKCAIRRLERSARLRATSEATDAWYTKCRDYRALLRQKREQFWLAKMLRSRDHLSYGVPQMR